MGPFSCSFQSLKILLFLASFKFIEVIKSDNKVKVKNKVQHILLSLFNKLFSNMADSCKMKAGLFLDCFLLGGKERGWNPLDCRSLFETSAQPLQQGLQPWLHNQYPAPPGSYGTSSPRPESHGHFQQTYSEYDATEMATGRDISYHFDTNHSIGL